MPESLAWVSWLFWPAVAWTVGGNFVLTRLLLGRGVRVPFLLQGLTVLVYPVLRPRENSGAADRVAASVVVALLIVLSTILVGGPFSWD